jgi:hypothetical protein
MAPPRAAHTKVMPITVLIIDSTPGQTRLFNQQLRQTPDTACAMQHQLRVARLPAQLVALAKRAPPHHAMPSNSLWLDSSRLLLLPNNSIMQHPHQTMPSNSLWLESSSNSSCCRSSDPADMLPLLLPVAPPAVAASIRGGQSNGPQHQPAAAAAAPCLA